MYSGHLKEVLHYTQEQIDDVGAAKDFGSILGLFSGFFYNYYPPWVTICIGALLHLFGYSMVLPLRSNGSYEAALFVKNDLRSLSKELAFQSMRTIQRIF